MHSLILAPVITLVLWTFVMEAWLYATRIPAITKNKIAFKPEQLAAEFHAQIPARVRWKADNFNHLHEQPTVFYAVALTLAVLNAGGGINPALAWVYVVLRIAHSLVQATMNTLLRFWLFVLSSLVLLALTLHTALVVF